MFFKLKDNSRTDLLLVLTLFLPLFWEQLASVLLGMISTIISSNIDTNLLNATSLVGSAFGPVTTIYGCVASGAAILISQYVGANDEKKARSLFSTSTLLGCGIALLTAILIIVFRNGFLRFTYPDMSEAFFENANIYSFFYALVLPLTFFRSNMIGILRGCLNTKGPLYISLCGGLADIILKFIFMVVFKLGIWGLGFASLVTNILFTVVCAVIIGKVGNFKGCILHAFEYFSVEVSVSVFKIGVVMCAQAFAVSIGALVLSKVFSSSGDDQIAAYTIVVSIESLFHLVPMALSYVAQILAGRHTGAGKPEHALKLTNAITLFATLFHCVLCAISYYFADFITSLYTDNQTVQAIAADALKVALLILPIGWSGGNILPAGIRGMGNVKLPAAVLILSLWLYKIPFTWYFCSVLNTGAVGRMAVNSFEFIIYSACFIVYNVIKQKKIIKSKV